MKQFSKIFLSIVLLLAGLNELILGILILFNLSGIATTFGIDSQALSACLGNSAFFTIKSLLGFSLIFISIYFFLNFYWIIKNNPAALTFAFVQAFLLVVVGIIAYPVLKNTGALFVDLVRGILIFIPALMLKLSPNK